jgi:hypothetical protein
MANVAYFQKKNPLIQIFYISGLLAIPFNSDKWSDSVIRIDVALLDYSGTAVNVTTLLLLQQPLNIG